MMMWLLFYPVVGLLCGLIVSAIIYEFTRSRWIALAATLFAPLPALCVIMLSGLAFMRDDTMTTHSLLYSILLLWTITSPFSVLAGWFVCHRKSRPQ